MARPTPISQDVRKGVPRRSLYSLNVLPVQLPPLRGAGRIPLLVQHFLQRLTQDSGRGAMTVSQEAMRRLMAYRWPGNVRQLENTVERAIAFTQGRSVVDVHDLPPEIQNQPVVVEGTEPWLPEGRLEFERIIEGDRAVADQASLERTQGKGQADRLLNMIEPSSRNSSDSNKE